jgi:hypothetical protein
VVKKLGMFGLLSCKGKIQRMSGSCAKASISLPLSISLLVNEEPSDQNEVYVFDSGVKSPLHAMVLGKGWQ